MSAENKTQIKTQITEAQNLFRTSKIKNKITEKKYNKIVKGLGFLSFRQIEGNEAVVDKFCNNDVCELPGEILQKSS